MGVTPSNGGHGAAGLADRDFDAHALAVIERRQPNGAGERHRLVQAIVR